MQGQICHFCKRFRPCERWFYAWRCGDCSEANLPPDEPMPPL
jgi:hypothetical protein